MRKALPIIIIFSLLLSGCTLTQNKQDQEAKTSNQNKQAQQETQEQVFTGSFLDAVKKGVGLKCTYEIDGVKAEGYIKGKKYRGKMQSEGKLAQVIMKDNCIWTWGEGQEQGIKTCYDPEKADETMWGEGSQEESASDTESTKINTPEGQYKCIPISISEDRFTPPSDIKFLDMQEMMQNYMNQ